MLRALSHGFSRGCKWSFLPKYALLSVPQDRQQLPVCTSLNPFGFLAIHKFHIIPVFCV